MFRVSILPTLGIVHLFYSSNPSGCDLVSHCGFCLHFLMADDAERLSRLCVSSASGGFNTGRLTPFPWAAGPCPSQLMPGGIDLIPSSPSYHILSCLMLTFFAQIFEGK